MLHRAEDCRCGSFFDDGAVLHHLEMLFADDGFVAGDGAEDIADRRGLVHGHDAEAVHRCLERLDRIDLGDDGATANDPLDADAGPNGFLNKPTNISATVTGGTVAITGSGDVKLAGESGRVRISISGSGDVDAAQPAARDVERVAAGVASVADEHAVDAPGSRYAQGGLDLERAVAKVRSEALGDRGDARMEHVALAIRAISAQRLRSFLTLLGIAVGIAAVILLTSIGEGIHRFVLGEFTQFGTNNITIVPGKTDYSYDIIR